MNITTGKKATKAAIFDSIGGWTTQFEIEGQKVGGTVDLLPNDTRLIWQLEQVGGAKGKRILELGPLEGAHTKMLCEAGAKEVIALEGLSDCFLRCLVVKEAFELQAAHFLFCDFNDYVLNYTGEKFDFVSAAGVLYHQKNPAELIYNISKITDTVIVWSHVASQDMPSQTEGIIKVKRKEYRGKVNDYSGGRLKSESFCGGLNEMAFWLYPDEMRRCFIDSGLDKITEIQMGKNPTADYLLFVASR